MFRIEQSNIVLVGRRPTPGDMEFLSGKEGTKSYGRRAVRWGKGRGPPVACEALFLNKCYPPRGRFFQNPDILHPQIHHTRSSRMAKIIPEKFMAASVSPGWLVALAIALGGQGIVLYAKVNALEASRAVLVDAGHREYDAAAQRNQAQDTEILQLQMQINQLSRGGACLKN